MAGVERRPPCGPQVHFCRHNSPTAPPLLHARSTGAAGRFASLVCSGAQAEKHSLPIDKPTLLYSVSHWGCLLHARLLACCRSRPAKVGKTATPPQQSVPSIELYSNGWAVTANPLRTSKCCGCLGCHSPAQQRLPTQPGLALQPLQAHH